MTDQEKKDVAALIAAASELWKLNLWLRNHIATATPFVERSVELCDDISQLVMRLPPTDS